MLELMYITNDPAIAELAVASGVSRIFIDLEKNGKELRQAGMNTVKSNHSISDISTLKKNIATAELLVRINPLYAGSVKEIESVIEAGADIVMLPMYRTKADVEEFLRIVNGRAKTMLLLETKAAYENLEEYIDLKEIDEIHIGLNDLHLELAKEFMFELLIDGTVEAISRKLSAKGIKFGFGGIARLGYGLIPAEYIIREHYKLGSSLVILSRSFCEANTCENLDDIRENFVEGIKKIRAFEKQVRTLETSDFEKNHEILIEKIQQIVVERSVK